MIQSFRGAQLIVGGLNSLETFEASLQVPKHSALGKLFPAIGAFTSRLLSSRHLNLPVEPKCQILIRRLDSLFSMERIYFYQA